MERAMAMIPLRSINFLKTRTARPDHASRRHGIKPQPTPRLTARQPFHSEPASAPRSVRFASLQKITRTTRLETAAAARSRQQLQHGRKEELITADEDANQDHAVRIELRRASCCHSAASDCRLASAADWRAISVSHIPEEICGRAARTISRKRRRTRLRTTAPPTRREVTRPTRTSGVGTFFKTLRTINFPWKVCPSRFIR